MAMYPWGGSYGTTYIENQCEKQLLLQTGFRFFDAACTRVWQKSEKGETALNDVGQGIGAKDGFRF